MTYKQIADTFGVTKQSVHAALKRFENFIASPHHITAYKDNRSNVLSSVELGIIEAMADQEKLDKAGIHQLAPALREVTTARRLNDGESTENVAQVSINMDFTNNGSE